MDILEIRIIEAWIKKLKRHDLYNRKWWPSIDEAKDIMRIVQDEDPAWFIEFGTGNGVTASFVAAAGYSVMTFDLANRPKLWLDETFPVKISKRIHALDTDMNYHMDYWINDKKTVWLIDVGSGEKTLAAIKKHVGKYLQIGDVIIERIEGKPLDVVHV